MAGAVHNPNGIQLYSHTPIGVVNTVLGCSSGFTCTWLTVSESSKVDSCWRKLRPTWLVLANYSAWYFLQMVVLKQNIRWLAAYFDNSAVYFKTFWQPYCILMTGQYLRSMVPCQVHRVTHLSSTRDTCPPFSSRKGVVVHTQAESFRPLAYWYDQGCIVALTGSDNPFLLQHL